MAEVPLQRIHIGGDQLTRERFTEAKKLRMGCLEESDALKHLGHVTFEFFHLDMKFWRKLFISNCIM